MASPNPSNNYQTKINHHLDEGELGIDIEPTDNTIDPTSLTFPSNNIEVVAAADDAADIDTMEIEGEQENAAARTNVYNGFGGFNFLSKKAIFLFAFIAAVGLGVVIGFGLSGIIEHKRQQQQRYQESALAAVAGQKKKKGGKPGKACVNHDPIDDEDEFCADDMTIECGATFTNEKVEISHDLLCTDYVYLADDEELEALNAAITLTGPDAIIDCKGHSINQFVGSEAISPCNKGAGAYEFASTVRKTMKETCDLYYQAGIMLVDGARAINCEVGNFYEGFLILNGGEVKSSEAFVNRIGVTVRDMSGSKESIVSDVYTHRNILGILVANGAPSNPVTINDVTSKFNKSYGMHLTGPVITVKDSTFSYNGYVGIAKNHGSHNTVELNFEGTVSSHHNVFHGMDLFFNANDSLKSVEVNVKGEFSTYLNGRSGLYFTNTLPHTLQITLEGGKSKWNSCQNTEVDVYNNGDGFVSFIDEGSGGYTCDKSDERVTGTGLPMCVACPSCV